MFKKKEEQKPEEKKKPTEAQEGAENPVTDETSSAEKAEEASSSADAQTIEQSKQSNNPDKPAEPEKPKEPDWKKLYAVTLADFDNYKKRAARDREDVYRYAESDILKDILPTVDNLALALDNAKDGDGEFVKGIRLVYDGLLKSLEGHGVKPMADLVGKDLDPNLHEAIAALPHAEIAEGKITTVVKTGWLLNDRLLRAAQVVTSAGKAENG